MKKLTAFILTTALILGLSACNNNNVSQEDYDKLQRELDEMRNAQSQNESIFGDIPTSSTTTPEITTTSPPDYTTTATNEVVFDTVYISDENQLRATVANAGNNPIMAVLTQDIEIISDFIIPGGVEIIFTSNENDKEFNLIATRNMTVITVSENAIMTINGVGVTGIDGGVGVNNSGTFIFESGTIRNRTTAGVQNSGTFFMDGGTISNNRSASGVVNSGNFTMNGGVIIENTTEFDSRFQVGGYGGGVRNSGVFTMNGGEIRENAALDTAIMGARGSGGGIYSDGTFAMNGGEISDNNAYSGGGGVTNFGTFIMSGGLIKNNTAGGSGGGVYTDGSFNMNGGTISSNTAKAGGGIFNFPSGLVATFIMRGGSISDNISQTIGGGVVNRSSFTMSNGTITRNIAESGGGVNHETSRDSFTLDGGWIFDNMAINGADINIVSGSFNNNVFDVNVGAIGSPPPKTMNTFTFSYDVSTNRTGIFIFEYYVDGVIQSHLTQTQDVGIEKEMRWIVEGTGVHKYSLYITSVETEKRAMFYEHEVNFTTDPPTSTQINFNDRIFTEISG